MVRSTFDVPVDIGLANAIRRSLTSDLENWAPSSVTIRENTSCQTDEYIAHRIGLIPFRRVGVGDEMTLLKTGGMAVAGDISGLAFEAVHKGIPLMDLADASKLDLTIHFDKKRACTHARYSTCSAVGMKPLDNNTHRISFELHDEQLNASDVILRAIQCVEERVDRALLQLANQPTTPPRSRCG